MAYPQGINFRATLGFVTDGTNESLENAANGSGISYPRTTAQGNTVGWESPVGNIRDRTTGNDRRLAGINFTGAVGWAFRFDLPSPGTYNVRAAFGDASSVNPTAYSLVDTSTVLAVLCTGTNNNANSFKDANNIEWTAAAWPASNTARTATFASTICRIRSDDAGANLIAHVYVESAAATGTNLTPGPGALTIAGFAPTIAQPHTVSPGPGTITITGYAPSVSQSVSLTPAPGALVLAGYAPTVTQAKIITPGAGALTITGFAPTVSQIKTISPVPGALVISGYAPAVNQPRTVTPGAGQMVITGYAPSISQVYFVAPQVFATTIMSAHAIDASVPALSGAINATTTMRGRFDASTIISAHPINGTGSLSAKAINGTANLL